MRIGPSTLPVSLKAVPGVPGRTIGGSSRPMKRRVGAPVLPGAMPIVTPASAAFSDAMSVSSGLAPISQKVVLSTSACAILGSSRTVTSTRLPSALSVTLLTWPASMPR